MAKESVKLRISENVSEPTRVVADGRAVKVGDALYSYDDDGLDCGFVMATDTKKREVRFYMLGSRRTIVMTERSINEGRKSSYQDDAAGCWARTPEEAKKRYVERECKRLDKRVEEQEKSTAQQKKYLQEAEKERHDFKKTHEPLSTPRFAQIKKELVQSLAELRDSLDKSGPVGRKKK